MVAQRFDPAVLPWPSGVQEARREVHFYGFEPIYEVEFPWGRQRIYPGDWVVTEGETKSIYKDFQFKNQFEEE